MRDENESNESIGAIYTKNRHEKRKDAFFAHQQSVDLVNWSGPHLSTHASSLAG